jgi:hypothetical protein
MSKQTIATADAAHMSQVYPSYYNITNVAVDIVRTDPNMSTMAMQTHEVAISGLSTGATRLTLHISSQLYPSHDNITKVAVETVRKDPNRCTMAMPGPDRLVGRISGRDGTVDLISALTEPTQPGIVLRRNVAVRF